jgi:hypothetical protein
VLTTVKLKVADAVIPFASLTWIVKLKLPAAVGVPLIAPDAEFKFKPEGQEPLVKEKLYGVVPPAAAMVCE